MAPKPASKTAITIETTMMPYSPAPNAEAATVDVTIEGILPTVAIAKTAPKRMRVRPAKYVRKSLGVPGIRKITNMMSSSLRASLSQLNRSNCSRVKNSPITFQPQRRTAQ